MEPGNRDTPSPFSAVPPTASPLSCLLLLLVAPEFDEVFTRTTSLAFWPDRSHHPRLLRAMQCDRYTMEESSTETFRHRTACSECQRRKQKVRVFASFSFFTFSASMLCRQPVRSTKPLVFELKWNYGRNTSLMTKVFCLINVLS